MTSPNAWKKVEPVETMNFAEIMSEEYAQRLHNQELERHEKLLMDCKTPPAAVDQIWGDGGGGVLYISQAAAKVNDDDCEDCSALLAFEGETKSELPATPPTKPVEVEADAQKLVCDSDELLAQVMQSQYDHEYNEELRRTEQHRNKNRKVTVSLDKFRRNGDIEFMNEHLDAKELGDTDEEDCGQRDWDRFETNENLLDAIPKCGFKLNKEDGAFITKHDDKLCGVRNACRVMSFPPEFPTGDGAGFDMRLSNKVFNELRTYSRQGATNRFSSKRNRKDDRRTHQATADMGLDGPTCMILYKLINNQLLEQINGIVSTGKEAVILHANADPAYAELTAEAAATKQGSQPAASRPQMLPKECAVKVFKKTLNEFKQRDRYIKDDYRFSDRFSKQNKTVVINMWAEKEMHNLLRMQRVGINCPDVVMLKKHVLVMSFIGDSHKAAPKLRDACLSDVELSCAYEEIVATIYKLYNEAKLVHADLSEYNILWHEAKCWFIDVAQSVAPEHPSALEFLMRDCGNIVNFFAKRGLPNIYSKEALFEYVTALNAETHNAAMLERIHMHGENILEATAPNRELCPDELLPAEFPFDLAWEKSQLDRQKLENGSCASAVAVLDRAAKAMSHVAPSSTIVPVIAIANTVEH